LRIRTKEAFPLLFAATQNNRGNAYLALAEAEEDPENCKRAIEAYEEALKIYSLENMPTQYAAANINLANAYLALGQIR
jgi:hypothetical protein